MQFNKDNLITTITSTATSLLLHWLRHKLKRTKYYNKLKTTKYCTYYLIGFNIVGVIMLIITIYYLFFYR